MEQVLTCQLCGSPFIGFHTRKYCSECQGAIKAKRGRKERAPFVPYGVRLPMVFCMNCGKETLVRHPNEVTSCRYCGEIIWRPQ